MNELENLVEISKYAGERFDLVQAGGGNSSVKPDGNTLIVKASGFLLSDVEPESGHCRLDLKGVRDILVNPELTGAPDRRDRERIAGALLKETNSNSDANAPRPSIETFLHALLYRYTLHTHPLVVTALASRGDWRETLGELFPDALLVDYRTPGIELALEMYRELKERENAGRGEPGLVFLRNHGLIVSDDDPEKVMALTESVLAACESRLDLDLSHYKRTTKIARLVNELSESRLIAHQVMDQELVRAVRHNLEGLRAGPYFPDGMVFFGKGALELRETKVEEIRDFREKTGHLPRIILHDGEIYVIARNLKKAREIEEVYKAHVLTLEMAGAPVDYLADDELNYLFNWEAEKYRQKI